MLGVNPAYDYHQPERFLSGLKKVALSVSFSDRRDETSSHANAVCPDHHFLEAWGDAEPVESNFSLAQPLIAPLFGTRAAQGSLLKWLGHDQPDYYAYLREFWQKSIFPRQQKIRDFQNFWERSLQDGVVALPPTTSAMVSRFRGNAKAAIDSILASQRQSQAVTPEDRYE